MSIRKLLRPTYDKYPIVQDLIMKSIKLHKLLVEKYILEQKILESQDIEILLEDRIDFLRKTYLPKIIEKIENGTLHVPDNLLRHIRDLPIQQQNLRGAAAFMFDEKIFNWIVSLDPDTNKKNAQWLFNIVLRKTNPLPLEDIQYVTASLTKFMQLKVERKLPADKTEINNFKNVIELESAINKEKSKQDQADTSENSEALAQSDVLINNSKYLMLVPKTKFAAMYWGRNANWCTGWGDPKGMYPDRTDNMFDSYNKRGKLYVIIEKNKPQTISSLKITRSAPDTYWQFQFETSDFENASGNRIDIRAFFNEHPEIKKYFDSIDGKPVSTFLGNAVFARGRGFVVKAKSGIMEPVLLMVVADDDGKLSDFKLSDSFNKLINPKDVAEILTEFKIHTGETDEAIHIYPTDTNTVFNPSNAKRFTDYLKNQLFYRGGKWGTITEIGKTFIRVEKLEWKRVKVENENRIALIQSNNIYIYGEVASGILSIGWTQPKTTQDQIYTVSGSQRTLLPKYSKAVLELLLKAPITSIDHESKITASYLTEEDAKILFEKKPKLCDIAVIYVSSGRKSSDLIKEKIIDWVNQYDVPMVKKEPYWIGDNLVIEKFKDIEEMVEELGDDESKYAIKILNGEDSVGGFDATADSAQIEDFIRSLDPDDIEIVGKYLQKNYPDDVSDIEDFDPKNARDVVELFKATDDYGLQRIGDWAYNWGLETGAGNEMQEAFRYAVEKNPHVVFLDSEGNPIKKLIWDTPCLLVAPIHDIIGLMQQYSEEGAGHQFNYDSWKTLLDIEIDINQPRDGWSDYSEEAGNERFAELVHEELEGQ